eukprot:366260-Chlamydomonas_euryale.AAC.43
MRGVSRARVRRCRRWRDRRTTVDDCLKCANAQHRSAPHVWPENAAGGGILSGFRAALSRCGGSLSGLKTALQRGRGRRSDGLCVGGQPEWLHDRSPAGEGGGSLALRCRRPSSAIAAAPDDMQHGGKTATRSPASLPGVESRGLARAAGRAPVSCQEWLL